ncbi:hypothetical protein LTR62_004538 [Meristemomyces frigidus]|uniref:Uncharacterized protein n=1 Tax=Meristemomyces frigidus TaxID=1508187 RepID=A0AAN7TFE2_9PEZI|nr:hypothetical protein LTR62_004538 [Meristemomyces frigidus]
MEEGSSPSLGDTEIQSNEAHPADDLIRRSSFDITSGLAMIHPFGPRVIAFIDKTLSRPAAAKTPKERIPALCYGDIDNENHNKQTPLGAEQSPPLSRSRRDDNAVVELATLPSFTRILESVLEPRMPSRVYTSRGRQWVDNVIAR